MSAQRNHSRKAEMFETPLTKKQQERRSLSGEKNKSYTEIKTPTLKPSKSLTELKAYKCRTPESASVLQYKKAPYLLEVQRFLKDNQIDTTGKSQKHIGKPFKSSPLFPKNAESCQKNFNNNNDETPVKYNLNIQRKAISEKVVGHFDTPIVTGPFQVLLLIKIKEIIS